MRSFLVAAALGLGLLSAAAGTAAAGPLNARAPGNAVHDVTPVHYQHGYGYRAYHQPRFAPPPRHHMHRHAPPPRHPPRYHPQQYGWRR